MYTYEITIQDKFDSRIYKGQFDADTLALAIVEATDYYTHQLDADQTGIEIVSTVKIL